MLLPRKSIARFLLYAACCYLAACTFSMRSLNDLPTGLHVMGIQSNNTYAELESTVAHSLKDIGVTIVSPKKAPYSLVLQDSSFETELPDRFNNSIATLYTYRISVLVGIQDAHGHMTIPLQRMSAVESIVHNVNQTDTPVMIRVVRQELIRGLSMQVYAWLTSPGLKSTLTLPPSTQPVSK